MYVFLHISLPPRFVFSRVRVAFSGLLVFTFGFSRWFFSGLKKDHGKYWKFLIKNRFWNRDREFFENFRKISKNPNFFQFKSSYKNFRNFRFFKKIRKIVIFPKKSKIFEKISISSSKSIFDQKISIFFHDLFFKTAKESSGESKREG